MKKALVMTFVLVLGLGFAAFAAPLSGLWRTEILFGIPSSLNTHITLKDFYSLLEVDYTISGWTFGSTMIIDEGGLENLFFDTYGTLGAFSLGSMLEFDPVDTTFDDFEAGAAVSIAGVNLYSYFSVEDKASRDATAQIGSGFLFGAIGTVGAFKLGAEVQFNLTSEISTLWSNGGDYYLDNWTYTSCSGGWGADTWVKGRLDIVQTNCTTAWSGLDIYVEYPFACLTVLTKVNFDCTNGFDYIEFELNDIDVGIPWLLLDDLDIKFTVQTKSIALFDVDIVLGDVVCLTPIMSLQFDPENQYKITGIALNALTLDYSWNGVTFSFGEIFYATWDSSTHYFTKTGGITTTLACAAGADYDEFFGIEIDGDSCCGGAFDVGIFNFFDRGASTGIFDWQETIVTLEFGVGTNITVLFDLEVLYNQIDQFSLGVEFTW